MTLTSEQRAALDADLPADWVRERRGGGGKALSYVEGWRVIAELNRVLGSASWSYDCDAKEERREEKANAKGEVRWYVTHTAKCVLRVGDATIGDYGAGHGIDADLGAAIESSIKEACTDALKRSAKSLGMRLGLALYDKEREHVAPEVVGPSPRGLTLIDAARAAVTPEARAAAIKSIRAAWAGLNDADRAALKEIKEEWR